MLYYNLGKPQKKLFSEWLGHLGLTTSPSSSFFLRLPLGTIGPTTKGLTPPPSFYSFLMLRNSLTLMKIFLALRSDH